MEPLWSDERIRQEVDAIVPVEWAEVHWMLKEMATGSIDGLLAKMRNDYEQRIAELEERRKRLEKHLDCHESDED